MLDDVSIVVGNQRISGWTAVNVSRGIEKIPSDFHIELTEYYPGDNTNVVVQPGQACQLYIGKDLVLTGYVDEYNPRIDEKSHTISISGRSKCEDIVDCSAEYPNSQVGNATALQLVQKFAEPYGITVTQLNGPSPITPQFNLMFGETAVEIIERICRFSQLLFYDTPDGNLVLSQVGSDTASCGFSQGFNVKSASAKFTMGQRYSNYQVVRQALYTLQDSGDGTNLAFDAQDKYVPRHRQKTIISEAGDPGYNVTELRAIWEAKRRFGKSFGVTLVTDSWRDSNGKLWTPNTIAKVDIPALKLLGYNWIISDVTYLRDEGGGTTATIQLYPPDAFNVEPILLQPLNQQELPIAGTSNGLAVPAGSGQ